MQDVQEVPVVSQVDLQVMSEIAVQLGGSPTYAKLLEISTRYGQQVESIVVKTDADEKQAVDSRAAVVKAYKIAEDMRVDLTGFPGKFVREVNKLFKDVKDSLVSTRDKLDRRIQAFRRVREALVEAEKRAAEQAQGVQPQLPVEGPPGEPQQVQVGAPDAPEQPDNVTRSESGHAMYEREDWDFEVMDFGKLVRAIGNKKKEELVPEDLLELKRGGMLKLIRREENPIRKGIPGVKIKKVKRMVSR